MTYELVFKGKFNIINAYFILKVFISIFINLLPLNKKLFYKHLN